MPYLNEARFLHSSCTLDNTLYVFCGKVGDSDAINTVEKLSHASSNDKGNRW